MELSQLRYFMAVAELGNMHAAARKLFIAQPAISQAIAEIERFYNVKLFERLSKKLYDEIAQWAEDDFRSMNGQIEYLLTECVKHRKGKKDL